MTNKSRRAFLALVAIAPVIAGCGGIRDSRFNPFNWFGRDRNEEVEAAVSDDGDPRRLVNQVLSLSVDPTPEGAIVRAVGLPPLQGFWDASLVRIETQDPSELVYEFRVSPPLEQRRQGPQRSREIIVGTSISNVRLANIRRIVVVGQQNRRTVSR